MHNLVSITRCCTPDIPLSLTCALARDGKRCPVRGTEEEWQGKLAKGGQDKKEAASATVAGPCASLSPRGASGGGHRSKICLRTQLAGFWVTIIWHDQDAHIGKIFQAIFDAFETAPTYE